MNKIPTIVVSKNRASQLSLLLESINRNFPGELDLHVLYAHTSADHKEAYRLLQKRFPQKIGDNDYFPIGIDWIFQADYQTDFLGLLKWFYEKGDSHFCIITDDCLLYRPVPPGWEDYLNDNYWALSFRLGLNTTTQYYATGEKQPPLAEGQYNKGRNRYVDWDWTQQNPAHNYGYNFSWDFCMYNLAEVINLVDFNFKNPRDFESSMWHRRERVKSRRMASPEISCAFCLANNHTQVEHVPAGLIHSASIDFLAQKYLSGQVIDYDRLVANLGKVDYSHTELPLHFKEYK